MAGAARTEFLEDMSPESNRTPRVALIGCGAIAEAFHLPALARHADVRDALVLVDPDRDRARALAARFGVRETAEHHRELAGRIDGAVVAVPARLHHPIGLELLRAGVHVLSEKPLCERPDEARALCEAADAAGVTVCVNQTRRLFASSRKVHELLAEGAIGRPRRIDFVLGEVFDWPAATPAYFGAEGSGKGVLLDTGAHIVDLVCWWLGGRPELVDYRDDSCGGTEAVAELSLERDGCRARIRLSWLSKLANVYRVEGETGAIEGGVYDWSQISLERGGRRQKLRVDSRGRAFGDFANRLADNFLDVLRGRAQPLVPGREALPSIEIIDACYARRARFEMPWHDAWRRVAA